MFRPAKIVQVGVIFCAMGILIFPSLARKLGNEKVETILVITNQKKELEKQTQEELEEQSYYSRKISNY